MFKALLAGAATLALGLSAHANTIYAIDIDWQNNGTVSGNNDRDNPQNALGAPDGDFLSLGLSNPTTGSYGFAVFDFGTQVTGPATVWEVTFNCRMGSAGACTYPESLEVWYGNDYDFGSNDINDVFDDFISAGELFNADAQNGASALINGTFRYLALVDTSAANFPNGPSTDGFDIDAVSVVATPLPGAAALILPALGVAVARRKRKV
ncbi:hypothetical protein [Parvularcula maris]|uniref:PEP-CTERM sorting domain-containing protein n=1 Tax=Parvularcula maris TaxID=2965077 RepID=A0A9X2RHX7_9PROT|nr:hypothetical protein [Parvularcula maris]MCQ8184381.1 hypothetical protein [Parvularcula maris]